MYLFPGFKDQMINTVPEKNNSQYVVRVYFLGDGGSHRDISLHLCFLAEEEFLQICRVLASPFRLSFNATFPIVGQLDFPTFVKILFEQPVNKPIISKLDLLFPSEMGRAKIKTFWLKTKLCKCASYTTQTQTWENTFILASLPWQNSLVCHCYGL